MLHVGSYNDAKSFLISQGLATVTTSEMLKSNVCVVFPYFLFSCVVTGKKNRLTAAHACRKMRLKWVSGAWRCNWATLSRGL